MIRIIKENFHDISLKLESNLVRGKTAEQNSHFGFADSTGFGHLDIQDIHDLYHWSCPIGYEFNRF